MSSLDYAFLNQTISTGLPNSYDGRVLPKTTPIRVKGTGPYAYVMQGTPLPLNSTPSYISTDMFKYAQNRASPNCCPNTYSTSTGCICPMPKYK